MTIYKWEKQLKKEGNLNKHLVKRPFKKIDPEKLQEYITANPEAYLHEIAVIFNYSSTAIRKALKRPKIMRKKRQHDIMSWIQSR
jgi:transposase